MSVAVVITARNAAATVAQAVASALAQPEVAEVVVVDDASTDDTAAAARGAGDDRLTVRCLAANVGPAAARNIAIAASTAPLIAILDADDWLLPGRFARLLAEPDWDLIADNIAFVPDGPGRDAPGFPAMPGSTAVGLAAFVRGNIATGRVQRGELGFLKPVIRRAVLPPAPVYDPALWLGEDYDLVVRLLAAGARMRVVPQVGYAARVRPGSLSGRHRTADLAALWQACLRHPGLAGPDAKAQRALRAHRNQLHDRYLLRAFLDRKRDRGLAAALGFALWPPSRLRPIAQGVLRDKLAAARPAPAPQLRTLLPLHASGTIRPSAQSPAASSD